MGKLVLAALLAQAVAALRKRPSGNLSAVAGLVQEEQSLVLATCQAPCGATEIRHEDTWWNIGHFVPYKPKLEECVGNCIEIKSGTSCPSKTQKVSKIMRGMEEHKLCCDIAECTCPPWENGCSLWKGAALSNGRDQRFLPLTELPFDGTPPMSCYCCDVNSLTGWDGRINKHCRFAYEWGVSGVLGRAVLFLIPHPLTWIMGGVIASEHVEEFKDHCTGYCGYFPEHKYAKKAVKGHWWGSWFDFFR